MRTALALCLAAALLAGCAHPPRFVRKNPLVRKAFYPPKRQMTGPLAPTDDTKGAAFDHSAYARVLGAFVDNTGQVDYAALRRNAADLNAYLYHLAGADLDKLGRLARLATLMNAYNAFTLKLIIENPGVESIRDIPSRRRWQAERWKLGGRVVSLAALEHDRIRAFGDPRVHFALVCAARGGPPLRNEPYEGARLPAQLQNQATRFLRNPRHFRYDAEDRIVYLSEIMDWYREDFAPTEDGVVLYAVRYAEPWVREEMRRHHTRPAVRYIPYDWRLNGTW